MYDDIRKHGGNAIMWKTGHSLIKSKMKEAGAALAGEMSGHLFFADRYYGYDDAIYAACRVVELLKKQRSRIPGASLSGLLADLPATYNTPEIRFDCPDDIKFKVVERVQDLYAKREGLKLVPREVISVDGVRAVFQNGWGLIRASNTQPVLVMRFEASDEQSLKKIQGVMEDQVRSVISSFS
jgi:phosphomannomutase/phosphoglucomutase